MMTAVVPTANRVCAWNVPERRWLYLGTWPEGLFSKGRQEVTQDRHSLG